MYIALIIAFIIIDTLVVILLLKRRLKITTPDGQSKNASLLQFIINQNPEILKKLISPIAEDKEKIIEEIKKFRSIKQIKEINKTTLEILTKYEDDSQHWYRAEKESEEKEARIVSLKKFS